MTNLEVNAKGVRLKVQGNRQARPNPTESDQIQPPWELRMANGEWRMRKERKASDRFGLVRLIKRNRG